MTSACIKSTLGRLPYYVPFFSMKFASFDSCDISHTFPQPSGVKSADPKPNEVAWAFSHGPLMGIGNRSVKTAGQA